MEGVAHVFGDAARVVDLRGPLRDVPEHAAVVDLLERLAVGEGARHLTGEEDERRRILGGGVDADRRVRRPRTARDQRDAGPPAELAVGVGHVRGAALVPADDEADTVARVVQPVQHRQMALARDAEDVVHALDEQALHQDLPAAPGQCRWASHGAYLYAFASAATRAGSNWFTWSISSLVTISLAGTLVPITFHFSRKSW